MQSSTREMTQFLQQMEKNVKGKKEEEGKRTVD